jgi:uncharacterized membrane protein
MSKKSLFLGSLFDSFGREKRSRETILFGLVLALSVALRFYDLSGESFWLDEVATTIEIQGSVPDLLTTGRMDQPPAYYLPLYLWTKIFGISEGSLRSFSALCGVGSVVLIYLAGRRLFGKQVGVLGAFLMAVSDFQILFSQEARNYSLFELAALLSFYFLVLFLDSRAKSHFGLYVVFSIFMIYANAFGICILIAQNLFFVFQIKSNRNWAGSWAVGQCVILLAITPYFSPALFGSNGLEGAIATNLSGISEASISDVARSFYRFILPPRRYFGGDMEWDGSLLAIYVVAGLFLVIGILATVMRKGGGDWQTALRQTVDNLRVIPDIKRNSLLVICWLLCPPLVLFVVSKVVMPVYDHRYVISAAPALYLLLALILFSIRKAMPLSVSIGALLILIAPGLVRYYAIDVREQWREAAAYVEINEGENQIVVFAPNDSDVNTANQEKAFNYYYRGGLPSCGVGPNELTDAEAWNALMRCVSGYDSFWVIVRNTTEDNNRYPSFFLDLQKTTLKFIAEQHFTQLSLYLFELAK